MAAFGALVTANSAGYRYGVSDQAYYIPAILRHVSPALFPHDAPLLDAQSNLMISDEVMAWLDRITGWGLPALFFVGYLACVALYVIGVGSIGTSLYASSWAVAAFGLALTLRHRIVQTGVNTFEGYFHTRVMAFGLGMVAIGALLKGRRMQAAMLVAAMFLLHPTTAAWFVVWIGVALAMTSRYQRRWAIAGAGLVGLAGLWALLRGPLAGRLVVMDPAWVASLGERDYLFPTTDWGAGAWMANLAAPAVMVAIYRLRRRAGLVSPEERGLFLGSVTLLAIFGASLPFVAARLALAVQLQTSRVLWMVDLLATAYLVWTITEARWRWPVISANVRARALVALLVVVSVLRGGYVLRVEHRNPLVAIDLAPTPWLDAAHWASQHTAPGSNFLAHPGHVWKYGVSFRVAAERDTFLDISKDPALGIYSRDIAMRVAERRRLTNDFDTFTVDRFRALAASHDLDYLIVDRPLPLPVVYTNGPLFIYALRASPD
jgi:hypothetical protein